MDDLLLKAALGAFAHKLNNDATRVLALDVLAVDDDLAIRNLLSAQLGDLGHHVILAASGAASRAPDRSCGRGAHGHGPMSGAATCQAGARGQ
ncbi:MAG: hypothetical protein HY718_15680 [Planctomycetes bacterium]|nr:hypothetical protein [Planctomycetota bacterium]